MDMWESPGRAEPRATRWVAFVGSWAEGPGQARVLLRGDLDADACERLHAQLETLLDTGVRFIGVDATGVTACDPGIVELLGAAQQRLQPCRGLLTLRGLHPSVLPAPGDAGAHRVGPATAAPRDDHPCPPVEAVEAVESINTATARGTNPIGRDPSVTSPRAEMGTLSGL